MSTRLLLIVSCLCAYQAKAEPTYISDFDIPSLDGWQQKSFKGNTEYQIISLNKQKVLRARSTQSASSLYQEIRIDLHKTPYLNWSWRTDTSLAITDEKSKPGDDFTARIYLIVKGKWFFWQTKAINYVWANHSPKNESWANLFAGDSVIMIAVRTNTDLNKHWYTEKRNVLTDFSNHFTNDIRYIDGIAIMTDTDNSGGSAISYYANIYFSEH